MQSRQGNDVAPSRKHENGIDSRSKFMPIARNIGRDLASTFAKLEKLTMLARKKSLFNDRPEEVQQLTLIIKQDINSLNSQIAQLQQLSRSQQGRNGHHKQSHSNSVVVSLQSHLASMSNKFKTVLEVRTENMKEQKQRREQFSQSSSVVSTLPASAVSGHMGSVLLLDDCKSYSGSGTDSSPHSVETDRQRYQQQLQLIDEQDSYIQSRAEAAVNIEQTIVELGSIFQQLAIMIKEQEETVLRIDANVEDTHMNIEAAHGELVKYFQSVTSNRWLMIKIFAVLIIFFIIFIVFLA